MVNIIYNYIIAYNNYVGMYINNYTLSSIVIAIINTQKIIFKFIYFFYMGGFGYLRIESLQVVQIRAWLKECIRKKY